MSVIIDITTCFWWEKNKGIVEEVPQASFHKRSMMETTELI